MICMYLVKTLQDYKRLVPAVHCMPQFACIGFIHQVKTNFFEKYNWGGDTKYCQKKVYEQLFLQ